MHNYSGKQFFIFVQIVFFFLMCSNSISAQSPQPIKINYDTNYYVSYSEKLSTRLYTSFKYTAFRIGNVNPGKNVLYNTNHNLILGFGATYSIFTLNIGLNFPFVNKWDKDKFGESDYLDLQTHIYAKKVTIDFYGQAYAGYYLYNSSNIIQDWPQSDTFYKRPDIKTYTLGTNVQYIFNYNKFSYRATYVQNEWQKKSAGSFVVGFNTFYISHSGDSSLIPTNINPPDLFYGEVIKRQDVLNIGISGGYYYNLVIGKHVFFSIGFAGGPSLGYSWFNVNEHYETKYSGINLSFNGVLRSAIGYNSERFFIGATFLNQFVLSALPHDDFWSNFSTGNFRINLVYRFNLKKPMKLVNVRYWKFLYKDAEKKSSEKKK